MRTLVLVLMTLIPPAYASSLCQGLDAPSLLPGSTIPPPETPALCEYFKAPAILVVNTASQCGFTPQFKDLEVLYERYRDQGLQVLGFPSDNFGGQEYSAAEQTAKVCYRNYGVSFPMFEKVNVKGRDAHVLFQRLTEQSAPPRWNFHKYLISSSGVQDFASSVAPLDKGLILAVEKALADSTR